MDDADEKETNTVRLSFRSTPSLYQKLTAIAAQRGWINSSGRPNVSKVLNYLIEQFELKKERQRGRKRK